MSALINQFRVDQANQLVASPSSAQPMYFFFGSMSKWKTYWAILNITPGATTSVKLTPEHNVAVGHQVRFGDVGGMTQLNDKIVTVLSVTGDTIVVNIDSISFNTFTAGGYVADLQDEADEVKSIDEIKQKIIAMKFISGDMMCHVIRRINWASGVIFDAFDSETDMTGKNFYCYSRGAIYLCVDNAAGAISTVRPIGTSRVPQSSSDGYIWKFVQRVDSNDYAKFASDEWLPVRPLKYTNNYKGSIGAIEIVNRGQNYNHNDVVHVLGDGQSASFAIGRFLANGSILNIASLNAGIGYTWAKAWIESSTGSGAILKPIVNKFDSIIDPVKELLATNVRVVVQVNGDEDGTIFVGQIRTTGLLRPDLDHIKEFKSSTIDTRSVITVDGNGQVFVVGDEITGLISGTKAICAGSSETQLYFVEESGKGFINGEIITSGVKSTVSTLVSRFDLNSLNNCNIVAVDNFTPMTRNSDQIDLFVFTLSF
jgi:hypothetical protein